MIEANLIRFISTVLSLNKSTSAFIIYTRSFIPDLTIKILDIILIQRWKWQIVYKSKVDVEMVNGGVWLSSRSLTRGASLIPISSQPVFLFVVLSSIFLALYPFFPFEFFFFYYSFTAHSRIHWKRICIRKVSTLQCWLPGQQNERRSTIRTEVSSSTKDNIILHSSINCRRIIFIRLEMSWCAHTRNCINRASGLCICLRH